jgi:hypothetical protein
MRGYCHARMIRKRGWRFADARFTAEGAEIGGARILLSHCVLGVSAVNPKRREWDSGPRTAKPRRLSRTEKYLFWKYLPTAAKR